MSPRATHKMWMGLCPSGDNVKSQHLTQHPPSVGEKRESGRFSQTRLAARPGPSGSESRAEGMNQGASVFPCGTCRSQHTQLTSTPHQSIHLHATVNRTTDWLPPDSCWVSKYTTAMWITRSLYIHSRWECSDTAGPARFSPAGPGNLAGSLHRWAKRSQDYLTQFWVQLTVCNTTALAHTGWLHLETPQWVTSLARCMSH